MIPLIPLFPRMNFYHLTNSQLADYCNATDSWAHIHSGIGIHESFWTEYKEKITWDDYFLYYQCNASEEFVEKYSDILGWDNIFARRVNLSPDFILVHMDKITYWGTLFRKQHRLSEEFIGDNLYKEISSYELRHLLLERIFSTSFLLRHSDRFELEDILEMQPITQEFVNILKKKLEGTPNKFRPMHLNILSRKGLI